MNSQYNTKKRGWRYFTFETKMSSAPLFAIEFWEIAVVINRNSIRWLRVGGFLLLLAVVAFGCRFIMDITTAAFPQYSVAIYAAVMILFAILLAYLVMPPILRELGLKILGDDVSSDKDGDVEERHDDHIDRG